jgi:hypothetical protein
LRETDTQKVPKGLRRAPNRCGVLHGQMDKVELRIGLYKPNTPKNAKPLISHRGLLTPLGLTYDRYERYARVSEAPHKLLFDAARRFDEYQHLVERQIQPA